jgi:uncharacterized protein YdcH (DUF465 family)
VRDSVEPVVGADLSRVRLHADARADQHFSAALEQYEYLDDQSRLNDDRGGELVSHLMELTYAWNDDARFDRIFPECAKLLDRVIAKGGAAPGT